MAKFEMSKQYTDYPKKQTVEKIHESFQNLKGNTRKSTKESNFQHAIENTCKTACGVQKKTMEERTKLKANNLDNDWKDLNRKRHFGKSDNDVEHERMMQSDGLIGCFTKLYVLEKYGLSSNITLDGIESMNSDRNSIGIIDNDRREINQQNGKMFLAFPQVELKKRVYINQLKNTSIHIMDTFIKGSIKNLSEVSQSNDESSHLFIFDCLMKFLQTSNREISLQGPLTKTLLNNMYNILMKYPNEIGRLVLQAVKNMHSSLKKGKSWYQPDVIALLNIIYTLYPNSDLQHPVTASVFVLINDLFNKIINSLPKSIEFGLLVASILLRFTKKSSTVFPNVLDFLLEVVFWMNHNHLFIKENRIMSQPLDRCNFTYPVKWLALCLFALQNYFDISVYFKSASIQRAANVLNDSFILTVMSERHHLYDIQQLITGLRKECGVYSNSRRFMVTNSRREILQLIEPDLPILKNKTKELPINDEIRFQREKVKQKLRREKCYEKRAIRRYHEFDIKHKIRKQIKSDRERNKKINKIFSDASLQQAELKAKNGHSKIKNS